jgi:hypothetical protein
MYWLKALLYKWRFVNALVFSSGTLNLMDLYVYTYIFKKIIGREEKKNGIISQKTWQFLRTLKKELELVNEGRVACIAGED